MDESKLLVDDRVDFLFGWITSDFLAVLRGSESECNVVEIGEGVEKGRMLKYHPAALANLGKQVTTFLREHRADFELVYVDLAGIRLQYADDVLQGHGFPHSAFPENEEDLAFLHLKRNPVEDFLRTECLVHVFEANAHGPFAPCQR